MYPTKCRVTENSKERQEGLLQCKEIEENNRKGKTRDLFKKIGNIKGIFHPKMDTIKNRNGKDLIEAKRSRRDGKNTQTNCTKKILMAQIIAMV